MSVTLPLLFDEDTEAKFARLCEKDGSSGRRPGVLRTKN